MEKNDIALSLGIPTVVILISLFLFTSIQPYGLQLEQQKVMAQQELQKQLQPQQELTQKVPPGTATSSNFATYTNSRHGFSLLYPSEWINEEIPPNVAGQGEEDTISN